MGTHAYFDEFTIHFPTSSISRLGNHLSKGLTEDFQFDNGHSMKGEDISNDFCRDHVVLTRFA